MQTTALIRPASVVVAAVFLSTGLAACSSGPVEPDCEPLAAGDNSALVSVSDATPPTLDFPTPLVSPQVELSVIEPGDGPVVQPGSYVSLSYVSATGDGAPGAVVGFDTDTPALSLPFNDDETTPPILLDSLECVAEGSTVVVTGPLDSAFGQGAAAAQGLDPSASVVFAFRLDSVVPPRADGAEQWVTTPGLPSVALAPDGTPGVTIPRSDPPTAFTMATLKAGWGPVVNEGDSVTVKYSGFLWTEQTQFDTTWDDGVPLTVAMDGQSVVPGFQQAIVGQRVGSQVIAVLPPEFAYGSEGSGAIPADATLVFVIDILDVDHGEDDSE